jgi:preprotein translocase subunit SecA
MTERDKYAALKIVEECAEVTHEITKVLTGRVDIGSNEMLSEIADLKARIHAFELDCLNEAQRERIQENFRNKLIRMAEASKR